MGLRDRLSKSADELAQRDKPPAPLTSEPGKAARRVTSYQQIKQMVHRRLIDHIDSARLSAVDNSPATRKQFRELVEEVVQQELLPLNLEERERLVEDLEHETFGLGPIEPLMRDSTIDDILVNKYDEVFIERFGRLERTDIMFRDEAHLTQVIERIVTRVGRRIDESSPMVDGRLPDGSRINAIVPPLAVDGPALSIRRPKQQPMAMDDLLRLSSLNPLMAAILEAAIKAKLNILISGGSGSGKTTLLNTLINYIGPTERIVSIEDTVELRPQGLHVVRLETRPPNIEGHGEITQRDLLKNALRMRPDRILVGEVRGSEALDMLQAMNTGHQGSIATIHANSPRDALSRLETMILMAGINLTSEAMRRQISSAIDVVIQLNRFSDGVRRIISICEMAGMEEQIIKLQEIAKFQPQRRGSGAFNVIRGEFVSTGVLPAFSERLLRSGVQLPAHFFAQPQADNGSAAV